MTKPHAQPPSPWATFALCSGAFYLTTLDLSIVNVAFPEIIAEFGVSRAEASWVVTTYNIFYASLLVVAGKSADTFGRRRLFRLGVTLFAAGSLMAATAPSLAFLIGGRAVQGIGGAILTPATLGLLIAAFPAERRTQVVAMWGGIAALGVASGPSIGAFVISLDDWRAAFWINVPAVAFILALSGRFLAKSQIWPASHRPDYLGAVMITTGLAATALGISQSDVWGWVDLRTLGSLAAGVGVLAWFLRRQRSHPEPILDLKLFHNRSFQVANFSSLLFFAGFAAIGLNNMLFLRQVWGYDVLTAGLLTAVAPATVALCSPLAGKLATQFGFRLFVTIGPVVVASISLAFTLLLHADPRPGLFVALGIVMAVGIAGFIPVNTAAAVAELPPPQLSVGGGINNTFRQVGSVLGVAALVAVLGSPNTPTALLSAHHRGWVFIAIAMLGAAAMGVRQLGAGFTVGPASPTAASVDTH